MLVFDTGGIDIILAGTEHGNLFDNKGILSIEVY